LAIARPERQAKVTIIFNDNSEISHHAKAVRGTPDNSMDAKDISNKAKQLLKNYNKDQIENLVDQILNKKFLIKELIEILEFKV